MFQPNQVPTTFFLNHYEYVLSSMVVLQRFFCRNPTLAKCEDETHTPKVEDLESFGTPENSKLDCRGQNTSHWSVFGIIGKVLKCGCPK
jgi:hypothetical protein